MTPEPPPRAEPLLPLLALVLSVLIVCMPPLGLLGGVLGVMGIVQAVRDPAYGRLGYSATAVGVTLVTMALGFLVALPMFLSFQARSKQEEVRSDLTFARSTETYWF